MICSLQNHIMMNIVTPHLSSPLLVTVLSHQFIEFVDPDISLEDVRTEDVEPDTHPEDVSSEAE